MTEYSLLSVSLQSSMVGRAPLNRIFIKWLVRQRTKGTNSHFKVCLAFSCKLYFVDNFCTIETHKLNLSRSKVEKQDYREKMATYYRAYSWITVINTISITTLLFLQPHRTATSPCEDLYMPWRAPWASKHLVRQSCNKWACCEEGFGWITFNSVLEGRI